MKPIFDLRLLISGLCAMLFALCSSAEAQRPKKVPRIGFLALPAAPSPLEDAFLQGLRDLGYIEGQNIIIEYRRAAGKVDRLSAMAEELVRLGRSNRVGATPVVDDEGLLQGSYEYFREAFPKTLRTPEKAMANALKFIDHPKAKQYDVTQSFDNSLVNEAR